MLFPQVLKAVETYYQRKVKPHIKPGVDEREVCLERYKNLIASNLSAAIRSDDDSDEGKFKPILDPYRPLGSTNGVFFQTTLPCVKTQRSHLSHIACHAQVWERDLAVTLERHPAVSSYVRNYRLGFTVPYEFAGQTHPYTPDFIVRIRRSDGSTIHLVLEVKGLESNQDRAKEAGARRWVDAVNNWGKLGPWAFEIVRDLTRTADIISKHSRI
jgi:type III restriction enzyme